MDLPGHMLTPSVRLLKQLRAGCRGSLWLAENLALGTSVSVQLLATSLSKDIEAVEVFMWGARLAGQIKSPHMLQLFGSGVTHDGSPYVLMEAIEGDSIRARVERQGKLSLEEIAAIVHQGAGALSAAHRAGMVHRGIHPESLFLEQESGDTFVKLLPFDVAAQVQQGLVFAGASLDVAKYMSPELLLSPEDVDTRADLWSLAAVAYYGLTGRAPFEGDSVATIFMAIDRAEFRAPSLLRPRLPAALDDWFHEALRRDIDHRFATAEALDAAFRRAAGLAASVSVLPPPAAARREPIITGPSAPPLVVERPARSYDDDVRDSDPPTDTRRRRAGRLGVALLAAAGMLAGTGLYAQRRGAFGSPGPAAAAAPAPFLLAATPPSSVPDQSPPPAASAAAVPASAEPAAALASAQLSHATPPALASAASPSPPSVEAPQRAARPPVYVRRAPLPEPPPTVDLSYAEARRAATNPAPAATAPVPATSTPPPITITPSPSPAAPASPAPTAEPGGAARTPDDKTPDSPTDRAKEPPPIIHQPDFGD